SVARRAHGVRQDLASVVEGPDGGRVRWTERRGRSVILGSSPVDVSELLREELFYRMQGVVLTSATLSNGEKFDFIKRRLGIDFPVTEKVLPSPFDFETQAALYVGSDLPDPRDAGFGEAAAEEIARLVELTGGGAFVLCTSIRAMQDFAARLRPRLAFPSMVQGEAPKASLLERFRECGDAVLFATAS